VGDWGGWVGVGWAGGRVGCKSEWESMHRGQRAARAGGFPNGRGGNAGDCNPPKSTPSTDTPPQNPPFTTPPKDTNTPPPPGPLRRNTPNPPSNPPSNTHPQDTQTRIQTPPPHHLVPRVEEVCVLPLVLPRLAAPVVAHVEVRRGVAQPVEVALELGGESGVKGCARLG
jgi:hypothetical protein